MIFIRWNWGRLGTHAGYVEIEIVVVMWVLGEVLLGYSR